MTPKYYHSVNQVKFYQSGSYINSEIPLWLAKVGIYIHSASA